MAGQPRPWRLVLPVPVVYGKRVLISTSHPTLIMRTYLLLFAVLILSSTSLRAADEVEAGFRPLFDGKTLTGWEGSEKIFRVADDAIVAGSLKEKIANNEFLCTTEEFGDFELRLEARLLGEGKNAGVQFRSARIPDHFEVKGYQCDMGVMADRSIWGSLYDESRRKKFLAHGEAADVAKAVKENDWNALVIRCAGNKVQIWVNGTQTVNYEEAEADIAPKGIIGLQIHGGAPAEAAYRNIRIKELK